MASKQKPDDLTMGYFITLIAKYYYSNDFDSQRLSEIVKTKLLEFDLFNYQEYKYHNKIINICNGLYNGEIIIDFKERDYIPIYENEINLINGLKNDRQKKLMFTFFVVARYMDCDGWINKKNSKGISEVFKLANVTLTSEKRNELLHELYIGGYISFGKKVDNLNINQYIGNFKKGYKQCVCCGKKIKVKSNKDYSSKYCSKCAYQTKLKQNNIYYHEKQ